MNIIRIIYEWPPPWLGLAPAPYEMTRAQTEMGHKVDIFCARWPNAGVIEKIKNVDLHYVFRVPFEGTIALTSSVLIFFKYLFYRVKNGYSSDIIHAHGHFGIWIYLYRYFLLKFFPWAKELKSPMIAHFHNTVRGRREKLAKSNHEIKKISKILDWPLGEFSDKLAIKVSSAYIFVSQDLKDEAIKYYGAEEKKCFVIESDVNPTLFVPVNPEEKAKTRIELNLQPQDKIILNVGAMVERKNIHLLVESLEFLPNHYKLLLMGTGDFEYTDKIEEIISKKELKNRVIKIGYTPYPNVPIAYQAADLFVLPSSFEGLPKVVMEALSCGLQVLAAGFKLSKEIRGLYYIENLTPSELAKEINSLITNPVDVDSYLIKRDYSWNVAAQKVQKIYDLVKENYLK